MESSCIIVCESIYNGNTMKLAAAMAEKIGCRIISPREALKTDLNKYQTIGLGSGIYFGCHHPNILKIARQLDYSSQEVFIFSSRGNPFPGKYHEPLKEILSEKGKTLVGELSVKGYDGTGPFVIVGGGNKGRPNEKDLRKAKKFISQALPHLCIPDYYLQINTRFPLKEETCNRYELKVNSVTTELKGDRVTINQNLCNGCGKCLSVCPLDVIRLEDGKASPLSELDCTLCELCIKNCSQRAINLHYTWRDAIKVAIRHGKKVSLN